jgi:hypothetical protein
MELGKRLKALEEMAAKRQMPISLDHDLSRTLAKLIVNAEEQFQDLLIEK